MNDLDHLLRDAGARWRASQPPTPEIDETALAYAGRSTFGWSAVAAAGGIGAGAVVVIALALGLWTPLVDGPRIGAGGPAARATNSAAIAPEACTVTRPNPPFAAPSPYPSSPADGRSAWFGTPALWTMLDSAGEVWSGNDDLALSHKTFWWSSDWPGQRSDPEPAITVVATRLDGPGTFTVSPATNAAADDLGGEAMLVGIEFSAPGCWQLTAQYQDAVLSYVAWIMDE